MKRPFAMQVLALTIASSLPSFGQGDPQSLLSTPEPAATQTGPVTPEAPPSAPPAAVPQAQPQQQQPPPKRSWSNRLLHPFSGGKPHEPDYKNPKLRGLVLDLDLTPQTVKLSEVRLLNVHVTLTNKAKRGITLEFPNDQRIDIHLMNPAETVLTRWSDNHAIKDKVGTLLINPQEHVEYKETIATRDLSPDKVYTIEVFFPKYPELRVRQKFLTAP